MRDDDDDDDDLSLVFYLLYLFCTQASFAVFRPQTGGKEPAFISQQGAREEVGGGSFAPPLISHLTKVCDEDNNRSPSAPCFCPFICLLLSSV